MERGSAKGSGITPELLLNAYSIGLFPMSESAEDTELFWVEPEVRGIIPLDGLHEPVVHPHRVVRVLAGDRRVGLAVPVGVEHRELG